MIDGLISINNISNEIHVKSLRTTFASIVPFFLSVGIIYIINIFIEQDIINNFISFMGILYCMIVNILYSYYYAQERDKNISMCLIFSTLYVVFCVYLNSNKIIVEMTLPILLMNIIGLEIIYRSCFVKFKIPYLLEPVNNYLNDLIPILTALFILGFFISFKGIYIPIYIDIFDFFLKFFSSIGGIILVVFLTCYFWEKGIHGVSVIGMICRPFWMQMLMINFLQVTNGNLPIYIGVEGFYQWFIWIGGSGFTLGLVILCKFFAKSKKLKSLGKEALCSSIFNINEQVIFGLPIALNNFFKIPFYIVPIGSAILTYFLMSFNYIHMPFLIAPWVFPSFIGAFWSVGGQLHVVVYVCILLILSIICYFPFFKKYDNFLMENEL